MAGPRGLHALARLHGVQTAYHGNDGARVTATPDALMGALRAIRVPVDGADLRALADHRRRQLWDRVIEPVTVAWHGDRTDPSFLLRLPASLRDRPLRARVGLEAGGERGWGVEPGSLDVVEEEAVDGRRYVALNVPLPPLPTGYHDLVVEDGRARREALLICAPGRAVSWAGAFDGRDRIWGVFAPLYALHLADEPDRFPTFRHLDRLAERIAGMGGSVVGTLPLLAAFLDRPFEPSPYSPVSRLFWNEVYIAVGDEPGIPPAGETVDFRAAMAARRPRLEAEARRFFEDGEPAELESFRALNPRADDYARFRALVERHGEWPDWQERLRARDVRDDDYDPDVARYHLYVQWRAERQLAEVAARAAAGGVGLYLDLPLGVHPAGYDVWRERALFAHGTSAGAPPDPLAPGGQDWGFRPLAPEASRLERHRYFIASIRHHLRFAKVLRIDHVMQLHRLFWVPRGGDARDGVYMRYPAEELYAILCLESHRARAVIVGEDLGTVPRRVRRAMRRHGLPGMYVAQFELEQQDGTTAPRAGAGLGLKPVPREAVASVGTHDTPMFAGWWSGRDVELRRELGQLEARPAAEELEGRSRMREELVRGLRLEEAGGDEGDGAAGRGAADEGLARRVHEELLVRLGRSRAGLVLATLEDLWLEREPQNVPGTTIEANWRRRAARPLEAVDSPAAAAVLERLDESRRRTK